MTNNRSQRVLITGGNRGIGLAIARGLLDRGCEVIITARSLESTKKAAQNLSGNVMAIELDIADDRSIQQAVETLQQSFDRLDVLINNAGIYPDKDVNILTISRELLAETMNTNTFGAIRMVQAFLPFLEKSSDARVISSPVASDLYICLSFSIVDLCLSSGVQVLCNRT